MQRRRYLALCGTAAAGLIAGCNEGQNSPGGGGGGGEAQFQDIIIQAPGQAAIDQEVTLTVSARNAGGEQGSYSDRLVAVDGDSDFAQDITISDVPAGETGSTEVPVEVSGAGEYRFELEDAGVAASLTVTAEAVAPGEMAEVGNGLQLTFSEVSFQNGVYMRYVDRVGFTQDMFQPNGGNILAVYRGTIENTGSQPTRIRPEWFTVEDGTVHATLGDKPLSTVQGLNGRPMPTSQIEPDESFEGWVIASVPRSRVLDQGVDIGWTSSGGGAERLWSFSPRALPDWAMQEFTMNNRPQNGMVSGTVTIRNQGQVTGTFHGLAEYHIEGIGWDPAGYPSGEIEPGASRTFSFEYAWPYTQEMRWRVQPFPDQRRHTVQGGPQTYSYGEQTTAVDGSKVTLANPRFRQSYEYEATESSSGSDSSVVTQRRQAGSGKKFLFVDVSVIVGNDEGRVPTPSAFSVEAGGETAQPYSGPTPTSPDVSFYAGAGGKTEQGQEITAALVFAVPENASNAAVNYQEDFGVRTTDITWQ